MKLALGMILGMLIILTELWVIEHITDRAENRWRRRFRK